MASTETTRNTTSMHDVMTDPENAREPIPGEKPGDASHTVKLDDDGPPDGGVAAWLVVLGAWCCSFSSPGWINNTYFPFVITFLGRRRTNSMLLYRRWQLPAVLRGGTAEILLQQHHCLDSVTPAVLPVRFGACRRHNI
jgi:hypothetical protein